MYIQFLRNPAWKIKETRWLCQIWRCFYYLWNEVVTERVPIKYTTTAKMYRWALGQWARKNVLTNYRIAVTKIINRIKGVKSNHLVGLKLEPLILDPYVTTRTWISPKITNCTLKTGRKDGSLRWLIGLEWKRMYLDSSKSVLSSTNSIVNN